MGSARLLMDITGTGSSSPQFMVESPPERLSPSNQRAFRGDDLSPVSDQPAHDKRKIAINIGASPSGFILEEDEEQDEVRKPKEQEQKYVEEHDGNEDQDEKMKHQEQGHTEVDKDEVQEHEKTQQQATGGQK